MSKLRNVVHHIKHHAKKVKKRHVAAVGLMFVGFSLPKINTVLQVQKARNEVLVFGSPKLPRVRSYIQTQSSSKEIAWVLPPDCGPAKPTHAPDECGVQQWQGYSETNPAADVWLAIINTGNQACTVTITQLTMSYRSTTDGRSNPTRSILSTGINGVQLLTDGTNGDGWGNYVRDLLPGSTFTLPANLHAYVHPFGPIVAIPEKATELTLTFAANISEGCAVSGGIDTFEEVGKPNTNPPYTKNGSVTDYIKEALKTPWITETVTPQKPVSYSIQRLPRSERTGWYKGKDE